MSSSRVKRHDTSIQHFRNLLTELEEEREEDIADVVQYPQFVDTTLFEMQRNAQIAVSVDPEAQEQRTWEFWVTWMQLFEAIFAMCAAPEGTTVTRRLHPTLRELPAVTPGPDCDAGNWIQALCLALTCRDEERVQFLCTIPAPLLKEAGESRGGGYDSYVYPYVTAFQDFLLGRPEFHHNLDEALRLADPAHAKISDSENLELLVIPRMHVLRALAERDTTSFDTAMEHALRSFQIFHTADEERRTNLDGTVPLDLFALACLAHDTHRQDPNFAPDPGSSYFPSNILTRSWEETFPFRTDLSTTTQPPQQGEPPPPVERHDANRHEYDELPSDLWEEIEELVNGIEEDPYTVQEARATLKRWALINLAQNPDADALVTWETWAGWMQLSEAFFAMSTTPTGATVERLIHHKTRTLAAITPGPDFTTESWLEAFYLALTFRSDERVPFLAHTPVTSLKANEERHGVETDGHLHSWARTLQDLVLGRPELEDNLHTAMELSAPERAQYHDTEQLHMLIFPPMDVLLRLRAHDSAEFNTAMRQGLESFRAYQTATEERRTSLEGVVPLALFALACMAYDVQQSGAAFTPDLRSSYLPEGILDRASESSRYRSFPL